MVKRQQFTLTFLCTDMLLLGLALGCWRILNAGQFTPVRAFLIFPMVGSFGAAVGGLFGESLAGLLFGTVVACFLGYGLLLPAGAP